MPQCRLPILLCSLCAIIMSGIGGILRGPYVTCVTQHSIVIRWTTEEVCTGSVEYRASGRIRTVVDTAVSRVHTVTLTDLEPSTACLYRAIAGRDTTAWYQFMTAALPHEPFVFGAYGDTRGGSAAQDSIHVGVLRQMLARGVRFAIHTGDLVDRNTARNWDEYYACTTLKTPFACTVPIFSVVGNHENGPMYYDELVLPHNPDGTEHWYSFEYGDIHFVAINSREKCDDPDSPQYRWIAADLNSPSARCAAFRIVFFHDPPYSSKGEHESNLSIRRVLCPLLEHANVDLVFSGHNHFYERSRPINGTTYVVAGAGGAPLYDFRSTESFTAYRESVSHGCVVTLTGDTLRMEMIRLDGQVRDSLVITSRTIRR